MRKDVKFGLTIGAILVVTLVIYVIVLSRGPAVPQRLGIALPSQSDQATDSIAPASDARTDSGVHTDVAPANGIDEQATGPAASDSNPATSPPPDVTPATQPASANDWENALNHGLPPTLSAPEHTVTPSIDSPSANVARAGVSPTASTPLIDPLPTTQPARLLMSNLPIQEPAPTPAVSPSTPPPPAFTPRTHRVASGESPYSISQLVYGSGKYYKKILAANPGIDPRHLKIGQILVIPELSDADKPAPTAGNASAAATVDPGSAYTVVSGDSLQSISRKLYGNSSMSDKLYEMNKSLIGPDENVLKIGWVLKLPKPPTAGGNQ
ncbi:MAG: LysM peptidoglycan-binding domain-containing protein [Tepidisphaeraceae bacterium]|jgi:nucleoid-associated protein YgaU